MFVLLPFILWAAPAYPASFSLFGDRAENVAAKDGLVVVNVSAVAPSSARHYRYRDGKTSIRFFLVRDEQNTVRAAIDACEACWREGKGYVPESTPKGTMMLCLNCGRRFPLSRIGIASGGCNPHPLKFSLEGDAVNITVQDLLLEAKYFPENGQ
jgi:uncharacterized membrane protein